MNRPIQSAPIRPRTGRDAAPSGCTSRWKPRLVLFDPNLKSRQGHNLEYAERILRCGDSAGLETAIVAHARFDGGGGSASEILGLLEHDYWRELVPGAGEDPHEHLSATSRAFAVKVLEVLGSRRCGDRDVIFFPCANLAEAMGMVRVAWGVREKLPRTVLLFRRDLDEQGALAGIGPRAGTTLLRQALADLHASPGAGRVRLLTDSDNLSEEYGEALRRRFQTAPIPVDPALAGLPAPAADGGTATILYIGDARTEKGYHRIPAAAERLRPELSAGRVRMIVQSNFNIPGGEPGIGEARAQLAALPNVLLLESPLSDSDYVRRVLEADLIVLPYEPGQYVARTSGILAEAIVAGVPVVAPAGTWLSDQLRRHGAGVIFRDGEAGGFAEAVASALGRLAELRERSLERRAAFAEFHNPDRLLRFVCGNDVLAAARRARMEAPGPGADVASQASESHPGAPHPATSTV